MPKLLVLLARDLHLQVVEWDLDLQSTYVAKQFQGVHYHASGCDMQASWYHG